MFEFFNKLEFKIRRKLSHKPILYGLLGGVGVVIFWRGIWHTTDFLMEYFFANPVTDGTINLSNSLWWDGPLSILVGTAILLPTGLFVSNFIGNEIIISGLKGEKKLTDKTEEEVRMETGTINAIQNEVKEISHQLADIEKEIEEEKVC